MTCYNLAIKGQKSTFFSRNVSIGVVGFSYVVFMLELFQEVVLRSDRGCGEQNTSQLNVMVANFENDQIS